MYEDEIRALEHYGKRARMYDWANRVAATIRGTSGRNERLKAIDRLQLSPTDRVLEICCGTGTNLALMREAAGSTGALIGLDISRAMLLQARRKPSLAAASVWFVEGEASLLPFRDQSFDAVFHHGGFAEFGDQPRAIAEMIRVAKPGAHVVISDVGVPTDRKLSLVNRLLLKTQPVYNQHPPTALLPPSVRDASLTWIGGGAWYLIAFTNPKIGLGE